MMIKRVLLLVVVAAFLVVPCLALSDLVILNSFDGWSQNNAVCTNGYFSFTGTGDAIYDLPRTGDPNWNFTIAVSAYLSCSDSQRGDLGLNVYDTSGNYIEVYAGMGYSTGNYLLTSGGDLIDSVIHTRSLPDTVSSSYCISRVGDEFTLSFGGYTRVVSVPDFGELDYVCLHSYKDPNWNMADIRAYDLYYSIADVPGWALCSINVYDSETRLPLSGDWDYYVAVKDGDSISGSASGAFKVVTLPETSILKPHLLYVTKDGYEQVAPLMFGVPVGGREVKVYLTPLETVAPEGSSVVTFVVTDIETGTPRNQCLVNVDGVGKYAGASGTVWFVLPENTTHQWVVTAEGYWPIGGNFTLGTDDLTIPVAMTKKTSDLPRPPLPDLPNFPVIHPSLDPAGFRMQILSVPILGGIAAPVLDSMDSLALGLDDAVSPVLDIMSEPLNEFVDVLNVVCSNLTGLVDTYTDLAGVLLSCVGRLLSAFPDIVLGLVSYELVLDLVYLILRGGL